MDGLEIYGSEYLHIRFQSALLEKLDKLDSIGRIMAHSALPRSEFVEKHRHLVDRLMSGVQYMLMSTSAGPHDYLPWNPKLSNKEFAHIIWAFHQSTHAIEKIWILAKCLEGELAAQPYFSPAAVRSITSLARMLDPQSGGVLNWRTLACLGFESMTLLKQLRLHTTPDEVQLEFEALDAEDIVAAMARLRLLVCHELPNTASVAAALYCVSLDIWPLEAAFERSDCRGGLSHRDYDVRTATVSG